MNDMNEKVLEITSLLQSKKISKREADNMLIELMDARLTLINKSISIFNSIGSMCERLNTGNVAHQKSSIQGHSYRMSEYLDKYKDKY